MMTPVIPLPQFHAARMLLAAALLLQSVNLQAAPPPGTWTQTFNEDFNGTSLDSTRWSRGMRWREVINQELQAYRPENVTVANGLCTIRAEKRTARNMDMHGNETDTKQYASGALQTYNKWTQTYGYFEARVRMASGPGTWPAFWLVPDRGYPHDEYYRTVIGTIVNYPNGTSTTCPLGNEIDIFEHMAVWKDSSGSTESHHGYFWAPSSTFQGYGRTNDGCGPGLFYYSNPDTQFHTFGAYWGPGEMIFLVDGVTVFRRSDPATVSVCPQYMILNMAMDTDAWTGTPVPLSSIDAGLPCTMDIDYVRVWSGTPSTRYHEVELLATSSTDSVTNFSDTQAGSRIAVKLNSNAIGDSISCPVNIAQPGTYSIRMRCKRHDTRGRCQLSIDGINQGPELDQFSSSPEWIEADLGSRTFTTSGSKTFRLAVTGRNASSVGYDLTIDYLKLEPVSIPSAALFEAESLASSQSTSVALFSEAGASGGSAEKLNSTAANDYIQYTVPVSQPGTYSIRVRYKQYSSRGRYQLAIDGVNQGSVQDQYAAAPAWAEHTLGTKTFSTAGDKQFRFTVVGRNTASSGYDLTFDYLQLQPQ